MTAAERREGGPRPCPLCGEVEAAPEIEARAAETGAIYRVMRCRSCELLYTRPVPTAEELESLYGSGYYVQNESKRLSDLPRRLFERSVLRWRRRVLGRARPGRILDFGCGNGRFLEELLARGWDVCGVELSATAADLAERRGVPVLRGPLEDASLPEGSFDVVTLWHSLEHLAEPVATLRRLRRLLRADGTLVVEVPNSASPAFRLLGADWEALDLPRHLQHFTPETAERLLDAAGFRPVRRRDVHHWDFTFTFYSLMNRLGFRRQAAIRYYSTDFERAPLGARLGFLAAGLPVAVAAAFLWLAGWLLTGNSETVTMIARPDSDRPRQEAGGS